MKNNPRITSTFSISLVFFLLIPLLTFCEEIQLTTEENVPSFKYGVSIRDTEKLAGVKLTLTYAENILTFKEALRSENTKNFLHVVNDKSPGKLTIVMASATGISGKAIPIIYLYFDEKNRGSSSGIPVKITNCELMTEDLKDLPCQISTIVLP